MNNYVYPFGETMVKVKQKDKTEKDIFVLGVYASAVHAKWIDADGKERVKALAVASEPYIFWRGDNAEEIIKNIKIPSHMGRLVPAEKRFNGPSGKTLDDSYLSPLRFSRDNSWLCDLVPHSYLNKNMQKAIKEKYEVFMGEFNLPKVTIPNRPSSIKIDEERIEGILAEIEAANPKVIILLGDDPIKYLIGKYNKEAKLSDFGDTFETYGKLHECVINNKKRMILPLAHPRHVEALGTHSEKWRELHNYWINNVAEEISRIIKEEL